MWGRQGWVGGLCGLAALMPMGSHPLNASTPCPGHRGSLGLTGVVALGEVAGRPLAQPRWLSLLICKVRRRDRIMFLWECLLL